KLSISAPSLMPDAAVIDPTMTEGLPPRAAAISGMEALSQSIEAYCAHSDHPMADAIALESIVLCARYMARAVHDGDDTEARAAMLKAAMMSGVAAQKGRGACEALAYPLSAECGLQRGLASALCLPAVL